MTDLEDSHQGGHLHQDARPRHVCTDLPFCLLFTLALFTFLCVYAGAMSGNMRRLYHGIDFKGDVCGVDGGMEDRPYLFWCISPVSQDGVSVELALSRPVCVSSCPAALGSSSADTGASEGCAAATGSLASAEYPTALVLRRYCLPTLKRHAVAVSQRLGQSATLFMRDSASVASAWPALLASFLLSCLLGYVFLLLLRHAARSVLLASIIASILLLGLLGFYLLASAAASSAAGSRLPAALSLHRTLWAVALGAVCVLLSAALACLFKILHSSVVTAAACVEAAVEVIFDVPSLLLVPAMNAAIKGLLSLALLFGFLMLQATADLGGNAGGGTNGTAGVHAPGLGAGHLAKTAFYTLVAFWILAFTNAIFHFAVAYAVAEYYRAPYDEDLQKDVGIWAVWSGLCIGLVYHAGSLALGSLLISVLTVFRQAIKHCERKRDSGVARCVLECCKCCVGCCDGTVQTVSEVAYADIAIFSDSFCAAATSALGVIAEAGGPLLVLNGAVRAFTIFGAAAMMAMSALATYIACSQPEFTDSNSEFMVENPYVPMLASSGISFVVALAFVHVLEMTSDTLLYCYALDLTDGVVADTAPPALRRLVIARGGGTGSGHAK
mmetsp:Transcript_30148/g.93576  ORF Transcript_30148/g.93576 Transcript_30148/m.93576 type:complete len:612 (+) Transcript_30148:95-1930(+)|eukprot:CAMPEP_0204580524 /NCGR_PEP_ID=MMETSP0661-20131031/44106_1 /ASSEMBLY_ACC=CAM_ASM_000606 /TAXON_ID=109239 /ORGANISM="Alexandrium margalefi, Strain AMGDE01CS-322" /LENGTH=611 /DNA_ID=CAMNT_0051589613 /DNA_START=89 /DNA_END=1924 /DNA_ORIENTATION=+